MLYREIMAVCSQIHTKHINTLCGQNVELLNIKLVVHIVTTGLWRLKTRYYNTAINYRGRMAQRQKNIYSQHAFNQYYLNFGLPLSCPFVYFPPTVCACCHTIYKTASVIFRDVTHRISQCLVYCRILILSLITRCNIFSVTSLSWSHSHWLSSAVWTSVVSNYS